ncbi:hypothetical protein GCM10027615_61130 [Plantactinospora veratri]
MNEYDVTLVGAAWAGAAAIVSTVPVMSPAAIPSVVKRLSSMKPPSLLCGKAHRPARREHRID